jgi:hypothetical protein
VVDSIYGPLNKKYCAYFYILSVIGFVILMIAILSTILIGLTKKTDSTFYMEMLMICITYGILYFHNRLLFSMCNNSTKEGFKESETGNAKPSSATIKTK